MRIKTDAGIQEMGFWASEWAMFVGHSPNGARILVFPCEEGDCLEETHHADKLYCDKHGGWARHPYSI